MTSTGVSVWLGVLELGSSVVMGGGGREPVRELRRLPVCVCVCVCVCVYVCVCMEKL